MTDIVNQDGDHGSIAAKGLETAESICDSLSGFGTSTGLMRGSDDLSFGNVLSEV